MYTVIDKANNKFTYRSVMPALKKFIACQNRKEYPVLLDKYGRSVEFRAAPNDLFRNGYTHDQIWEGFREDFPEPLPGPDE